MNRKLSPGWLLFILTGLNLFNYLDRYVLSAVALPLRAFSAVTSPFWALPLVVGPADVLPALELPVEA